MDKNQVNEEQQITPEEAELIEGISRIHDLLQTQLGEIKESRTHMQELITGMKESNQKQENSQNDIMDSINKLKQQFAVLQKNDLQETQDLKQQASQISQEDSQIMQQFQQMSEIFQKKE